MMKRTIAVMLVAVMTCLSLTAAESQADQSTRGYPDQEVKIKAKVQKTGVGEKSKIRVKLRDGTKLRGYVSNIGNDSFTVTDSATHKARSLSYGDVETVRGKGLSTAAKVLIVTGIGLAIVVVIVAVKASHPLQGLTI
jgi:hypothetical protein